MEQNFGNQQVTRKTKSSKVVWLRIGAVAAFFLVGAAGLYFVLNPIDPEDTIMGYIALGLAVFLPAVLVFLSFKIRAEVTIYDEGVIVKGSKGTHKLHFSEIAGLRDANTSGGNIFIGGGLGVIGAIVVGAAQAAGHAAADASRRRNRIRDLAIVPKTTGAKPISVVNTGGDELSQIYTEWLIKQHSITAGNINSLNLSFGEDLNLRDGIFTHKHRKGDEALALADISTINFNEGSLDFFALNDKGKERRVIHIRLVDVLNVDLLFTIYEMQANGGDHE